MDGVPYILNHNVQHFGLFPAKVMTQFRENVENFWGIFGPFAQIWVNWSFAVKLGSVTFLVFWNINLIQIIRRN